MIHNRRNFLKTCLAGAAAVISWCNSALFAFAKFAKRAAPSRIFTLEGSGMNMKMNDWSEAALRDLATETGVAVVWDDANRAAASEDYGHIIKGASVGVAYPHAAAEVEKALTFVNKRGLRLTGRGVGHSASGHSIAVNALTLDFSKMNRVEKPNVAAETVVCEPGARWRDVAAATVTEKLIPRVLPLNLDLTVGGTLSVGGVGPTAHRYGPIIANVVELDVVTGDARRMRCSFDKERALFDAMLAGLGRCGIIVSATLALRQIKPAVRTFYLLYDDVNAWIADQRMLAQAGKCDHLEAFCTASVQGLRKTPAGRRPFAHWFYGLYISIEYEPGAAPEASSALAGLHYYRRIHVEDDDSANFPARYDPRFEMIRRTGAMQQPHPIFECILPVNVLADLLPRVLDALPLTLGDGHRLIFLAPREMPRFFMTPANSEAAIFAVLPTGVAPIFLDDTLKALKAVHQMCMDAGGKRYLAGWLGMMDSAAWRAHYGERYDEWVAAKRKFDPNGVLGSALFGTGA